MVQCLKLRPLLQVYVEDKDFLSALCRAATAENKTTPVLVHITVSTGAVSPHGPTALQGPKLQFLTDHAH